LVGQEPAPTGLRQIACEEFRSFRFPPPDRGRTLSSLFRSRTVVAMNITYSRSTLSLILLLLLRSPFDPRAACSRHGFTWLCPTRNGLFHRSRPRSTSATSAPSSRARKAAVIPAGPPPTVTTSNIFRLLLQRFDCIVRSYGSAATRDARWLHRLPAHTGTEMRISMGTRPRRVRLVPRLRLPRCTRRVRSRDFGRRSRNAI
jgi:hypothetical protein